MVITQVMAKKIMMTRNQLPVEARKNESKPRRLKHFYGLLLCVIAVGVFFRFYEIDRQIYWNDEVYTSLRVSGYRLAEIEEELRDSKVVQVGEMAKYQQPAINKTVVDTVGGLIEEEPQVAPLYFVLTRLWVRCFGSSTTVFRLLSAIVSVLTLPLVFWLCVELFNSVEVSWIATALVAVSPAQVVFAQEARPYSLFVMFALLASVCLLRALRVKSKVSWAFYGVTVVLGLYTQVFFGFVAAGHAVYVFGINRSLICRATVPYIAVSSVSLLAFGPWLLVMFGGSGPKGTSWTHTHQSFLDCATRWAGIVSRAFVDFGVAPTDSLQAKLAVMPVIALVLLFVAYSVYFLIRNSKIEEWLFVVTLVCSVALVLFLMDVTMGRRYGTTRYILASVVGLQISCAFLIASVMKKCAGRRAHRRVMAALGGLLFLIGGVSCIQHAHAGMWWNKAPGKYQDYPRIAEVLNAATDPVVFCSGPWRFTQMLCHELEPNVRICLVQRMPLEVIRGQASEVFLFFPPDSELESEIDAEEVNALKNNPVVEQRLGDLWQVVSDTGRE